MEYFNIVLVLLFISVFAYAIFKDPKIFLGNRHYKEATVAAKISDKRIQENQSMRFGFGYQSERERYYLTFSIEDGSTLEFKVTQGDFYDFEIGTTGKITYQGEQYKGFESDETPRP